MVGATEKSGQLSLSWTDSAATLSYYEEGIGWKDLAVFHPHWSGDQTFQILGANNPNGRTTFKVDSVTVDSPPCDFSITEGEKCFGALGDQCNGDAPGAPVFTFDNATCKVKGWVSAGSIQHDACCYQNNDNGFGCKGFPSSLRDELKQNLNNTCVAEFLRAVGDVLCKHYWSYEFGSYLLGASAGDQTFTEGNVPEELKAPAGTIVDASEARFCQSGRCDPTFALCPSSCKCE